MFLLNSRLDRVTAPRRPPEGDHWGVLLPKLRTEFAEFLSYDLLEHLSILCSSTCVGLGYERVLAISEVFLGSMLTHTIGSPVGSPYCRASAWWRVDFPARRPAPFNLPFRREAVVSRLRNPC